MYLYFFSYRMHKSPIKIGVTSNINRRLNALNTGSAWRVEPLLIIRFNDRVLAEQTEKLLHDINGGRRKNGEWFDSSLSIRDCYSQINLGHTNPLDISVYRVGVWRQISNDNIKFLLELEASGA